MTSAGPVLYAVICGVSNAASSYDFIADVIADGWRVCVITTPMGARFVDTAHLADLTGHPVRSTYKNPTDPDILPPADAYVVAPASFNTVNKLANGISDTLAVGIVCEAIGNRQPIIVAPWMNRALANYSAYARSIRSLQADGVRVVLTDQTKPGGSRCDAGGSFPWTDVLAEVRKIPDDLSS
ncbi:flavoprotein [Actinoplanes sp. ATCC 53533]|uniref:flavoprotein n=1 Tax=Actinoplanes sp. ATCC 53533 TaxID=1288362 RepID=UPI000F77DFDF|nr:flavoprotein [Actinoplanes sp. ATCC 53533]RSM64909.1 flavoprotein [Actinoplanes sp. ATCC 53533]